MLELTLTLTISCNINFHHNVIVNGPQLNTCNFEFLDLTLTLTF
jgi:hypothetical protein